MKKYLLIASVVLFAACNDDSSTTTNTTAEDSAITTIPTTVSVDTATVVTSVPPAFESRSFVNLETGKPVTLKRNAGSYKYVDASTNTEVRYYYDPITKDTFDSRGYILNNSLILSDGKYKVDEVKVHANPDNIKVKDEISKFKMDKTSSKSKDGDTKIKERGDMYKEKTDSTKLKVDDKKMKVKSK